MTTAQQTTRTPTTPITPAVPAHIRRRLVAVLFAGQSFFSAGQIVSFAVLPIVVVGLSGTESVAGVPATLSLIGRALAAFPAGWLMDRVGRRFGLSLGFMLCTVGGIVSALAIGWVSLLIFLLGIFVAGMGRGIAEQARYAAAEVETADRRAKAIGLVVFASTIGAVLGPRLLAPSENLALRFNMQGAAGPFIVGAALFYLSFMLTLLFLRPDPLLVGKALDDEAPAAEHDTGASRTLRAIFADWHVRLSLLAMTIGQLVMTSIMVITPLHMNKSAYTTDDIGWVLMAHTIGMFALASVTGWLVDRTSSTTVIGIGGIILVVAAAMTPLASSLFLLMLALFLLGLGWNFCFVAGSSLLSAALRPGERGRVQGASETLVSLASGLGSLSVGAIFAISGMTGLSLSGLVFALLLIVATVWIVRLRPLSAAFGD